MSGVLGDHRTFEADRLGFFTPMLNVLLEVTLGLRRLY